jgi:ABC-type transport system involved in multi-copper enzyme maturation permease subunit
VNIRDTIQRLDRVQQSRGFKLVASGLVLLLGITLCIVYGVRVASDESISKVKVDESLFEVAPTGDAEADKAATAAAESRRSAAEATGRIINDILDNKQSIRAVVIGTGAVVGLMLVVIWLGLGLTYLALGILAASLAWLAILFGRGKDLGLAGAGLVALIAAFSALMQAAKLLFSGSHPVMAVARNTLAEAVRMKISLVFIVLMIFGLALLPLTMDTDSPLRYRIQSFIQFSTVGTFWLIALLVLTFSVSSVAIEQRDKLIWQTMTKPVQAWQYILGKWLGVVTLGAALLLVAASGIFLFTEYLRSQPAVGEREAYVSSVGGGLTEDRLIVETQVLTARSVVRPVPMQLDNEQLRENIESRVDSEMRLMEQTSGTVEEVRAKRRALAEKIETSLIRSLEVEYRVITPDMARVYRFEGLGEARESDRPIILRFKFESGSNRPDAEFKVTIQFVGSAPAVIPIGLGQFHTLPITPAVIAADGSTELQVINGDVYSGRPNSDVITFSPEGMEISYTSGGFVGNYFRCVSVLWVKLAFLAMLAIAAATFLSFSVASLVSMATFLAAEGAGFVNSALENYATDDGKGNVYILNTITSRIAGVVGNIFKVYADLRPTARLVEGLSLPMGELLGGVIVLAGSTAILFVFATYVFRKRELALYSGN